jgi:uncharacterized protein
MEVLAELPLFAGLAGEELEALSLCLGRRVFGRGVFIFHKDSPGQALYIIESGLVRLFVVSDAGQEISLNVFGPGEVFGELAVLDGRARASGAVALETTVTRTLLREDLFRLLEKCPRLARNLMEALTTRLRCTTRHVGEQSPTDWEAARDYALARLEGELPPDLTYHNLWHTCDDLLPAVQRLVALVGIGQDDTRLLETAAVYHDIGFTVQRQGHERLGAEIAAQALPRFGFSPAQVAAIQGMIMATQLPQSPRTPLEEILADADLDVLGREDFWARNQALRNELAASGTHISDERWLASQLQMLQSHHYWTAAARALRAEGKQKNIEEVRRVLAQV